MFADVVTVTLPRTSQAPGSILADRPAPLSPQPEAQLRLGVRWASTILQPFVPSPAANLPRLARITATAIAVNAPPEWTVADLVDWLTTTAPRQEAD